MNEKLIRFMYGRYGVDKLSKHLVFGALIISLVSMFLPVGILYPVSLVMVVWGYFRIFSRNHAKRYQEGAAYERFLAKLQKGPNQLKYEMEQRKDYRVFKCPNCKQRLRIPKGRGMVEIRCRKCAAVFRKRT